LKIILLAEYLKLGYYSLWDGIQLTKFVW